MRKSKVTGIIGTTVLHVLILVLLFVLTLVKPEPQEEGGVPVMLGEAEEATGDADPYTLTEVDVMPQQEAVQPEPSIPEPEVEQPMITQAEESPIQVKKEKPKKEETKPQKEVAVKPKEKTEAEKRAEAERAAAPVLHRALEEGRKLALSGERSSAAIIARIREVLDSEPLTDTEYVDVVDLETVHPVTTLDQPVLVAIAVRLGTTRLIDNFFFPDEL